MEFSELIRMQINVKKIALGIVLHIIAGSIFAFLFCPHCFIVDDIAKLPAVLRYYIVTFFLVWQYTKLATRKINDIISVGFIKNKEVNNIILKSFLIYIPVSILYVFFRFKLIASDPSLWGPLSLVYSETAMIMLYGFCLLFQNWRNFYKSWAQKSLESEIIMNQKLNYEIQVLSSQLNPHFLFNNLNTLTNLVHKDSMLAEKFINKLAIIYRYVLEQKSNNLIKIEEELTMLESYQFLINIRFGKKIIIQLDKQELTDFYVAPLVLQMLIENAIKHNKFTLDNPLAIDVYINEDCLIVKNNIENSDKEHPSLRIGLENIKKRYLLVADKEVLTEINDGFFFVKIPIIQDI